MHHMDKTGDMNIYIYAYMHMNEIIINEERSLKSKGEQESGIRQEGSEGKKGRNVQIISQKQN